MLLNADVYREENKLGDPCVCKVACCSVGIQLLLSVHAVPDKLEGRRTIVVFVLRRHIVFGSYFMFCFGYVLS